MNGPRPEDRTFDALNLADLDKVYAQGKEEVLRDHAFRILLSRNDTAAKLEELAFGGESGLDRWTTKELIEITNRFRLLSSPENEIRLYRQCRDEAFRRAPRVREFYLLALNKTRQPAAAIEEGSRIVAEGGQNALVWGTLGESCAARMIFAEKLARALEGSGGNPAAIDPRLLARLPGYFPEIDPFRLSSPLVRALRRENLQSATRIFRRGFRESGSSFAGLGWMLRTIDHLTDLVVEHAQLLHGNGSNGASKLQGRIVEDEIKAVERELECQSALVGTALEMQGGSESLEYWTHAGTLLLALIGGGGPPSIRPVLARLFATADADFQLAITSAELSRLKDNYATMLRARSAGGRDTATTDPRTACLEFAVAECDAGRARFRAAGRGRGGALNEAYREEIEREPADVAAAFLTRTINFRAMTSSLIPLHISGGIGRVGSRVPDLVINRRVQGDLVDLLETKILRAMVPADRENPRAVIRGIQRFVGTALRISDLQDLQSPAHDAFDIRSDGLIALSGIDPVMRRDTRTATDLTAVFLMQNGDCRETMYLNGTLFACWQQLQVKRHIARAMLCLEMGFHEGFWAIVREEIPGLMRCQLRGGQFALYVDSMAMREKYRYERATQGDGTALLRPYGLEELRSGRPLTRHELENSKIEVIFADGSAALLEPRDAGTGKWRPIEHTPAPGGGVPVIAGAGNHYENIRSIRLLNLVEEHAMTFLYDAKEQKGEFCDGFYNENLFDSPYRFGAGPVELGDMRSGLIRAGSRILAYPDGSRHPHPVYLEFLPFSRTDYESALVEGDIPGTIQLMGRTFSGDLKRERARLEDGTSPLPVLLERVQDWQNLRRESETADRKTTENRLARLILDLAREKPGLVHMTEMTSALPLTVEGVENTCVYLVLSGQLQVCRSGRPLLDQDGEEVAVSAGGIVGEISALRGGPASATVSGNAVVLGVEMAVIRQQLEDNPEFRCVMEEMAGYRVP